MCDWTRNYVCKSAELFENEKWKKKIREGIEQRPSGNNCSPVLLPSSVIWQSMSQGLWRGFSGSLAALRTLHIGEHFWTSSRAARPCYSSRFHRGVAACIWSPMATFPRLPFKLKGVNLGSSAMTGCEQGVTVWSREPYQVRTSEKVWWRVSFSLFLFFFFWNKQSDAAIHHFPGACFQLAAGPPPCLGLPLWHQGGEHSAGKRVGVHVSPRRKESRNRLTSLGLREKLEDYDGVITAINNFQ